ncbi:alpha/beta fold hydrolase [Allostreptomyces psammosilenae]|uniref:Pimeloyl-ACP methyl ester carboxylesterase n=1 Tax=Allostreptomyces psammosilenae TaxID=1892865 RepID=A0A853A2U3_9ACTN|nr:alpha/beta hydrolase [Allostreptomyces psammosilenae]NYI04832.1 pimeloyl-ACP methyl ester carboxylesterase [Allostreptomyces psammosilenae]
MMEAFEEVRRVRLDSGPRIAYRVVGPEQAPPVVLLHAMGESSLDWIRVARALADRRRVHAVDLRGHGDSDRPGRYSFELMREDVVGLLAALGLRRPMLVGHSLGGLVAALVAQHSPGAVGSLVMEEPPPPLPASPPRQVPPRPQSDPPFDWAVVPAITAQRNAPDPAWWDGLVRIQAPSLLVAGGSGSHLSQGLLAAMADRIPNCRLVTLPRGHQVHASDPLGFVDALGPLLRDREAAPAPPLA